MNVKRLKKIRIIIAAMLTLFAVAQLSVSAETYAADASVVGHTVTCDGVKSGFKNTAALHAGDSFEVLVTLAQKSISGSYGGSVAFSFDSSVIVPDKTAYVNGTEGNDDYSYAVNTVSVPGNKSGWRAELESAGDSVITVGITDASLTLMKSGESVSFTISFTVSGDAKPGESVIALKSSELIDGQAENVTCSPCEFKFVIAEKGADDRSDNTGLIIAVVSAVVIVAAVIAIIAIKRKRK